MKPPLIVFDLDGTLVDSRQDLADSANELLAGFGAAPLATDEVAAMVGDGARQLVARALTAAALDVDADAALDRFLEIYDRRLLLHTKPYDGLPAILRALAAKARLAVLTNKPEAPSRRILDALGLAPAFGRVIGGDSGWPRKPDPAGLRQLLAWADVGAAAAVMVGDSMVDVETARRAGVRVCIAAYGFGRLRTPLVPNPEDLVAATPAELLHLLQRER